MDESRTPKISQKADKCPIAFYIESFGSLSDPVTLPIRPEDLTFVKPQRVAVHQTLGTELQGWVDHFGGGLNQININGHTGWGYLQSLGRDGVQSFMALYAMVATNYAALRQEAIDKGMDPSQVKLLYVDLLNGIARPVVPTNFQLRRSKSSPLLMRYSISLQATAGAVDGGIARFTPPGQNVAAGASALDGALGKIQGLVSTINKALNFVRNMAKSVMGFINTAVKVLKAVQSVVKAVTGFISGVAGAVIGVAKAISQVGRELFNTLAAIRNIPNSIKNSFMQMKAAFNEVVCIFSNALRPARAYDNYEGLYGASNCSSTTGGRMPSAFSNTNVFAVTNPQADQPVTMSGAAITSASVISKSDSVLRPLPQAEMARHLNNITAGTKVVAA